MRITAEQEQAVQDGQPVHLQKDGLHCVVIRADLFEHVSTFFENNTCLKQLGKPQQTQTGGGDESAAGLMQPWTEIENSRRCELIDEDIQGTITEAGKTELDRLQERFHRYLDDTLPPPIEGAQQIHQRLLDKKLESERDASED